MAKLVCRVLLELAGDAHVLSALEHLRVDDIRDDRLVFTGEVFVQSFDQLRARYGRVGHVALLGGEFAEPNCMKRSAVYVLALLSSVVVGAQTRIAPPDNSYTASQDVELGRKAASEARQTLPVMRDEEITGYVESIGHRLAAAIPPDLQHPEFRYTFEVVNVREINAFALPGGPMFVNRGMIEAAHTEGEVAGVMAHELSHVVLRHGTAQAGKATKYEVGTVAGAVLGAIIGGRLGSAVAQTTKFGLGTAFLRFGREFEEQADIEGSHIMARAGYDPRDMANMFKTIEKQSGPGGPQWLSDHPNPGDRSEYIAREAQLLRVENPI